MEKNIVENVRASIIVYTYKYVWQDKDGKLCVKYLTDVLEAHARFMTTIKNDSSIKAAYREYINEVNFEYLNFTETFKVDEAKKDGEENETV